MNTTFTSLLKLIALTLFVTGTALCAAAQTQPAKLQIGSLEALEAKANQVVDVNIDEHLLRLIPVKAIHSDDVDLTKLKDIILGLKGVYVKSFEFTREGEYAAADIAPIRAQLKGPGWTRFINFVKRNEGQSVEVYMMTGPAGGRFDGLAIIAAEPKELTVVNIVGVIDLDKLSQLEGQFGIPDLGIEAERQDKKPAPAPKKP